MHKRRDDDSRFRHQTEGGGFCVRVKERGAALKCAREPTETPTIISEAAQRLVEAGRISFGAAVRSIVRPTPL